MWRVSWCGSFSEFYRCFNSKEEAQKFFDSLIARSKQIYFN